MRQLTKRSYLSSLSLHFSFLCVAGKGFACGAEGELITTTGEKVWFPNLILFHDNNAEIQQHTPLTSTCDISCY
jgi:hypothetical protein